MKLKFHIHNQGNADKENCCCSLSARERERGDNCIFMCTYPGDDDVNELCALEWRSFVYNLRDMEVQR